MNVHEIIFYALIAIFLAMLCRQFYSKSNIPYPVFLVIIGYILSEVYSFLGFDTGIRASNFHALSQFIFIPIILFSSAFSISPQFILKDSLIHFLFAVPITLITIGLATVFLYLGIGHPSGFPWSAALLTASILAVTGSHAIEDYLVKLKVPHRLIHILQIESLFTAIIAVFFYNLFSSIVVMADDKTIFFWLFDFIMEFIGGIFIGVIISYAIIGCLKVLHESIAQAILIIAGIYAAYILCDIWEVSGEFAVFTLGFFLGSFSRKHTFGDQHFIGKLFESFYLFAISGLFLLVGTTITWSMFEERWLAMLIGIVAVLLARAISVYGGMSIYNLFPTHKSYQLREQSILVWAGVRAALPIALAFGIPDTVEYWWTIQSIVFGVVLFGLIIQAPFIGIVCKSVTKEHSSKAENND